MPIIRHSYLNASDNLAEYAADSCGRQAVTVDFVHGHDVLCDATVYTFNTEDYEFGLDPWRIVFLDKYVEGRAPDPSKTYILSNYSGTRETPIAADTIVFIQKNALTAAGFEIPESRKVRG